MNQLENLLITILYSVVRNMVMEVERGGKNPFLYAYVITKLTQAQRTWTLH